MDVTVLFSPNCSHRQRIEAALKEVNLLQAYFRLRPEPAPWLPNDPTEKQKVDRHPVHAAISKTMGHRYAIAVTQSGIAPDWLVDERRTASLVTVAGWESKSAPPALKIYLIYQFASALLNFAADLSDEQIESWSHEPAIGCAFDWYSDVRELKRCMIAATLCAECETRLGGMGLPKEALEAFEKLLDFVRRATIRRAHTTPRAVFIGHGHSPVWMEVHDFVTHELGLDVQEFDAEETAGTATTARLEAMLNNSAFAILVMTAEDSHADQTLHARENVVHEIGLFQGRLGFHRALILKEEGTALFSNIHGLTYVDFPKGDVASVRERVLAALKREGIV